MKTLYEIFASPVDLTPLPNVSAGANRIDIIISVVTVILGAIALLVIVVAGFQFITSRGDPNAVAKAKNAIMYALLGLVILLASYTIVTFVLNNI